MLQSGNECHCGDRENRRYEWASDCNTPCAGIATEKCGGEWRLDVYRTGMREVTPLLS